MSACHRLSIEHTFDNLGTVRLEHTLPLSPTLETMFPTGLRRGATISVSGGQGTTSVAFSVAAAASAHGAWCAAVGFADLGLVALAEMGIDLSRLALVPDIPPAQWVTVVGALLDAVDVLLVRPPAHLKLGDARRLIARARERGTVFVPVGRWTESAEVRLVVDGSRWEGTGAGDGHLRVRRLDVRGGGRGAASKERSLSVAV